ncbi:unnamed protein product [Linum tenue]|uniref:Uncharacterized protein n=2 Tax=Linum tenue TaxID=586396 RepID=A0AAV0MB39_9ROSI|nr:unnamed protein product [Linum tenue]
MHMDAAYRILRYLKASPGQGSFFPSNNPLRLTAYCDADWGGCQSTRRSTTGYFISLGGAPVSWRTKKQRVVARSSPEQSTVRWPVRLVKSFGFGGSCVN